MSHCAHHLTPTTCVECLTQDLAQAESDRDYARAVAAVLVHAYDNDNRPPDTHVADARMWLKRARPGVLPHEEPRRGR